MRKKIELENIKGWLEARGIRANKTYGQNFLLDDTVLHDAIDASGLTKDEAALEIGPGPGTLTELLCERAGYVLSLEKDPQFFSVLKGIKDSHENFRFEIVDALTYDFSKTLIEAGFKNYRVVANVPYYITGKLFQLFLRAPLRPKSITVLVQKEVGENVCALPGNYSQLSISVQLFGKPRIVRVVPAEKFYPAPKVQSVLLHVDLYDEPAVRLPDEKKFFRVIRACFSGKRKQLHNTLKSNLKLSDEEIARVLQVAGVPPTIRPQELTLEQWATVVSEIQ